MPTPTPELGLQKALDADDTANYLDTSLANSLTTLDSLFSNVSGHTHGGVHQGGPISSVPASAIPDGSITSAKIADGSISTLDLADGAVTSVKIADGTIATGDLADGAVTSAKIADGTIATADIAAGAITAPLLAAGAVGTGAIADGAVNSAKIADGSIASGDLAGSLTLSSPTLNSAALNNSSTNGYQIVGTASANFAQWPHIEAGVAVVNTPAGSGGNFGGVGALTVNFARAFSVPPVVVVTFDDQGMPGDVSNYAHGVSIASGTQFVARCQTNQGSAQNVRLAWIAFGV
jgi:hypothetical protein